MMPDYRRVLSYLYRYDNGDKKDCKGFVKAEQRNHTLKLTVQIQDDQYPEGIELNLCFYERNGDEWKVTILDQLHMESSREEKLLFYDEGALPENFDMQDQYGVVICYQDLLYYGSVWIGEDIPVDRLSGAFMAVKKTAGAGNLSKVESEEKAESGKESAKGGEPSGEEPEKAKTQPGKKSPKGRKPAGTGMEKAKAEAGEKPSNEREPSGGPTGKEREEVKTEADEKSSKGRKPAGMGMERGIAEAGEKSSNERGSSGEPTATGMEKGKTEPGEKSSKERGSSGEPTATGMERGKAEVGGKPANERKPSGGTERPSELSVTESGTVMATDLLEAIRDQAPVAEKIFNSAFYEGYQINTSQLMQLGAEADHLSENQFLLKGYERYHHLLAGKVRYDGKERYCIGVPGVYENREKYMAQLYQFPVFLSLTENRVKTGRFGYWLHLLS